MGMFHLVSSRHFKSLYTCDFSVTTFSLHQLPPLQCSSSLMSHCLKQLKHLSSLLISFINCCIDPQGKCFANYQHHKCQLDQTCPRFYALCVHSHKVPLPRLLVLISPRGKKNPFWFCYKLYRDGDAKYMTATDGKKELFLQLKCESSFALDAYPNE